MATAKEGTAAGAGGSLGLWIALALLALVLWATRLGYAPPAPLGAQAPAGEFSAGRAQEVLRQIVGDGVPRPTGSASNARARQVLVDRLSGYGYQPEVQTAVACRHGTCAEVHNVLARRPGSGGGPAVLLAAHYDSVPDGPGAADDGANAAAVVEVARILAAEPPAANPVLFLLDDGEEAGLLGARAFLDRHSWASRVGAVVNLEARGTSGPSLMFETGPETAWAAANVAASLRRPVTSSVFYTIYKTLPNDTDFTLFKQAGIRGFNFAFIEGVENYHRPSDDLDHLNAASLQQQGDDALALVRRLAAANLATATPGGAVFFDLLGRTVVWWPDAFTLPLAAVAAALLVAALVLMVKRRALAGGALGWGLLGWLLMVLAGGLGAFVLARVLGGAGALPPWFPWVARPMPAIAAFWALAVAAAAAVAVLLGKRTGFWGAWSGVWLWWTLVAVVLVLLLPGVSYLFLVPALVAALLGLLAALRPGSALLAAVAALAPMATAAVLWFFLALVLYHALGTPGLALVGILVTLVATTLAPQLAAVRGRGRWAVPALAAGFLVAFAVLAAGEPPYSAAVQRPFSLTYYQEGAAGPARWLVAGGPAAVPAPMRQAADFAPEAVMPYPWWPRFRAAAAPAAGPTLPPPELTVLSEEGRRLTARLVSPRGAPVIELHVPMGGAVAAVSIAGEEAWKRPEGAEPEEWKTLRYLTLPPEGVEVEAVLDGSGPVDAFVSDRSYGLPPDSGALPAAAPDWVAPMGSGDVTVVSAPVRLGEGPPAGAAPAPPEAAN